MNLEVNNVKIKTLIVLCFILIVFSHKADAKKESNKKVSKTKNVTSAVSSGNQVSTTSSRPLLPGLRLPCSCVEGQCGCCTGVLLDQFNQKACLNVSYEPDDFSLTAVMSMNGRVLYKRTVSGKNPPPMCFRLPRFQFIRFCVEFSNIYFASRNIHLCIDMEANWEDLTLVEWSFDCVRLGASGVAVVGPEDGGGLPARPVDAVDQTDEDYDDSARNANVPLETGHTIKLTHSSTLVLDSTLGRADRPNADKALIKINKLPNGDVRIAYGRNEL